MLKKMMPFILAVLLLAGCSNQMDVKTDREEIVQEKTTQEKAIEEAGEEMVTPEVVDSEADRGAQQPMPKVMSEEEEQLLTEGYTLVRMFERYGQASNPEIVAGSDEGETLYLLPDTYGSIEDVSWKLEAIYTASEAFNITEYLNLMERDGRVAMKALHDTIPDVSSMDDVSVEKITLMNTDVESTYALTVEGIEPTFLVQFVMEEDMLKLDTLPGYSYVTTIVDGQAYLVSKYAVLDRATYNMLHVYGDGYDRLNRTIDERLANMETTYYNILEEGGIEENDPSIKLPEVEFYTGGSLAAATDRFVSIHLYNTIYYVGDAYGQHTMETIVYDRLNGEVVALDDFFVVGSDYKTIINQAVKEDVQANSYKYYQDLAFESIQDGDQFYVTTEGIVIYFQQHQYAPYYMGNPEVFIPFYRFGGLLKPEMI